jgi:hypothetical protein
VIKISRFLEIGTNKTTILLKLIENDKIVKCLVNNQNNFLGVPLPENFDVTSLIYNSIYPYRFVPTVEESAKTFITMKFSYRPYHETFKNNSIYFYIITHNSLLKTDYQMLRYDFLANQIDETFNSSEELGFGKLEFVEMDEILVNENYSGIYICYKNKEFQ